MPGLSAARRLQRNGLNLFQKRREADEPPVRGLDEVEAVGADPTANVRQADASQQGGLLRGEHLDLLEARRAPGGAAPAGRLTITIWCISIVVTDLFLTTIPLSSPFEQARPRPGLSRFY
jgi:hypothetical protein